MRDSATLSSVLCAALECISNQALQLHSGDTRALVSLEQKTLTLELAELGFPISVTIRDQNVLITTLSSLADCTLTTSISTLVALKNEQQLTQLIKDDQLEIDGDIKIAQQFSQLAESLHIDWQSELAKHIGDIATYKLVNAVDLLADKTRFAKQQIESDFSEWLLHESKLAVTHTEMNHFHKNVDQASIKLNELATRITALSQHIESLSSPNTDFTAKGDM